MELNKSLVENINTFEIDETSCYFNPITKTCSHLVVIKYENNENLRLILHENIIRNILIKKRLNIPTHFLNKNYLTSNNNNCNERNNFVSKIKRKLKI